MSKPIDVASWNAAIEAAATLIERGYIYYRTTRGREFILPPGSKAPAGVGPFSDSCNCTGNGDNFRDVAAILSLKKQESTDERPTPTKENTARAAGRDRNRG